jgi:hypothetical protein
VNARTAALDALEALDLPYWVTGSDALSLTGYARTTVDTDIVVDVVAATYEASLRPALEARGLYVAALGQVGDRVMGQASAGATWVDLILPAPGIWTASCRERRVRVPDPVIGRDIWIVSPEDLVLAKLAWARGRSARQVEDATRILAAGSLDLAYCRPMAVHLGISGALEAVVEASHAG